MENKFELISSFIPAGDQPQAIELISNGILDGKKHQTILGATGTGKTYVMAQIIQKVNRPTLVLAHNKTLAAQLCTEFRQLFPNNAVEYFVSYYDYYQPEAYIPSKDVYIEKDSNINEEIDRLRHSATASLSERRDVIIVASVSCIYSLGDPINYREMVISLRPGIKKDRDSLIKDLVRLQYERNDLNFVRNKFRVRGDIVEIYPAYSHDTAIRVEFFADEIERIREINTLTGEVKNTITHTAIFPASHYIISQDKLQDALARIRDEMDTQVMAFTSQNKLIEAQRISQRTQFDMEMLMEVGICKGIENYSSIFAGRSPGETGTTLLDYFPEDFIMFIDESHVTLPQINAMYGGDYARKKSLIDYGFRLPSAYDNRPLRFEEFKKKVNQLIFVSATPSKYEKEHSELTTELIIRPTGLIDPEITIKPVERQIEDLLEEIKLRISIQERVLVTTLTKRMAEDLSEYLTNKKIKVKYMHHEIDTFERMEIIRDLRSGTIDVLIGINLLREGLDMPEVSLIAILDADKEGFLRSETSLIQTIGRAARNSNGHVIMYADHVTGSMERAINETYRRREKQIKHNEEHNITPTTVKKDICGIIEISSKDDDDNKKKSSRMSKVEKERLIDRLTKEMKEAAKILDFEHAAFLRDRIEKLQKRK